MTTSKRTTQKEQVGDRLGTKDFKGLIYAIHKIHLQVRQKKPGRPIEKWVKDMDVHAWKRNFQ